MSKKNSPQQISGKNSNDDHSSPGNVLDLGDINPRALLEHIMPGVTLPENFTGQDVMKLIIEMISEPEKRKKLAEFNTLEDALNLLRNAKKILVLTGAGVSVSCGIPDFRSKNGIYARLHKDFPDLPDPQAMFDIEYFRSNPAPFFDFAREIFPGQFKPSLSHMFIKALENNGQLLRNYTQNIDTLEQVAKIDRVIQCHGSFSTATCCNCKCKVDCDFIKNDVFEKKIPRCPNCPNAGEFSVLKPDITFFGESLSKEFHDCLEEDKNEVDLLIVIGSSLKVRPVSLIPNSIPHKVPQILINREPLTHMNFDIELLGDCDDVISELSRRLGEPWNDVCDPQTNPALSEIQDLPRPKVKISPPVKSRSDNISSAPQCSSSVDADKQSIGEIDRLKGMYKPRLQKIANDLPENSFLFMPPNRYIFKGAEVFRDLDSGTDNNDDDSCSSSPNNSGDGESSSDNDEEVEKEKMDTTIDLVSESDEAVEKEISVKNIPDNNQASDCDKL